MSTVDTDREQLEADEACARRSTKILGKRSGAAKALRELDARRAAGEDVQIVDFRGRWIVGPIAKFLTDTAR